MFNWARIWLKTARNDFYLVWVSIILNRSFDNGGISPEYYPECTLTKGKFNIAVLAESQVLVWSPSHSDCHWNAPPPPPFLPTLIDFARDPSTLDP